MRSKRKVMETLGAACHCLIVAIGVINQSGPNRIVNGLPPLPLSIPDILHRCNPQ